jgi:antitoxin (DNA-binding transcriptional repressor) of toxin-antitoxin stability system
VISVGAYEAKTRFSELLADDANGETVVVTKHGVPVGLLGQIRHDLAAVAAAVDEWERYRDEHTVTLGGGITVRELIEEGRE